jgi:hypothetical protein
MDNHTIVRLLLIIAAAFVLFMLIAYYNRNRTATSTTAARAAPEKFSAPAPAVQSPVPAPYGTTTPVIQSSGASPAAGGGSASAVMPSEPLSNEQYRPVEYKTGPKTIKDCYPKDRLTSEDLLPKDAANSKWAQSNPAGQGDIKDQNFLTAGYLVGVNTQGQTLRNANMQLRSEPPNPQFKVSPWNQSTIEPDTNRRPLELGGDC